MPSVNGRTATSPYKARKDLSWQYVDFQEARLSQAERSFSMDKTNGRKARPRHTVVRLRTSYTPIRRVSFSFFSFATVESKPSKESRTNSEGLREENSYRFKRLCRTIVPFAFIAQRNLTTNEKIIQRLGNFLTTHAPADAREIRFNSLNYRCRRSFAFCRPVINTRNPKARTEGVKRKKGETGESGDCFRGEKRPPRSSFLAADT